MSRTTRNCLHNHNYYVDDHSEKVRDGACTIRMRSSRNRKRSTRKLQKLQRMDAWDIPNHDKFGRIV